MTRKKEIGSVIALGTFDGMHPGHRAVIDRAVEEARGLNCESMVFTFANIPRGIFSKAPVPIMTEQEREKAIRERGVDTVVMAQFNESFSRLSPSEFIKEIIMEYHPIALVTGEDYTFGHRASGNIQTLIALGKEMGFKVITIETVRMVLPDGSLGEKISSTAIRRAISENRPELIDGYMHGRNTIDQ